MAEKKHVHTTEVFMLTQVYYCEVTVEIIRPRGTDTYTLEFVTKRLNKDVST
jgi:hypothetical protein